MTKVRALSPHTDRQIAEMYLSESNPKFIQKSPDYVCMVSAFDIVPQNKNRTF